MVIIKDNHIEGFSMTNKRDVYKRQEHLYARLAFLQRHRYTGNKEGSRRICACGMESFMIRFIITALFVILFLILSIPLLIAEWIIGKFNPPLKDRSSPVSYTHLDVYKRQLLHRLIRLFCVLIVCKNTKYGRAAAAHQRIDRTVLL